MARSKNHDPHGTRAAELQKRVDAERAAEQRAFKANQEKWAAAEKNAARVLARAEKRDAQRLSNRGDDEGLTERLTAMTQKVLDRANGAEELSPGKQKIQDALDRSRARDEGRLDEHDSAAAEEVAKAAATETVAELNRLAKRARMAPENDTAWDKYFNAEDSVPADLLNLIQQVDDGEWEVASLALSDDEAEPDLEPDDDA